MARRKRFFKTFSTSIDKTGKPRYRRDILEQEVGEWIASCPSTEGGHNWQAMSYHPATEQLIIPLSQSCMEMSARKVEFTDGSGGTAGDRRFYEMPGTDGNVGKLAAFDVKTMKEVWTLEQRASFLTAVLSTGRRHRFAGDLDREFRACDVNDRQDVVAGSTGHFRARFSGDVQRRRQAIRRRHHRPRRR